MPKTRMHLGNIVLAAFLLGAAGCGNGSDSDPASGSDTASGPETSVPSTDGTAPQECPGVISTTVVETLGWTADSPAVLGRGGCAFTGAEGNIVVVERPDSYNHECERLTEVAPPTTFRSEVADGVRGCGYVRDEALGLSEWVLDMDGRVVSLSVAALTNTAPDKVGAALLALTDTAANVSVS